MTGAVVAVATDGEEEKDNGEEEDDDEEEEEDDDDDKAVYIYCDVGGCGRFGLQHAGGCAEC